MRNFPIKVIYKTTKDDAKDFVRIPNMIALNKDLHPNALTIYVVLAVFCGDNDNVEIFNKDILEYTGIKDPHTLSNHMKQLIHFGYVVREVKRKNNNKISGGFLYTLPLKYRESEEF